MAAHQTLAAFYQCHKQPRSFLLCLESFRKFYPDSSIYVVNDGGYDYSHYCRRIGADYSYVTRVSSNDLLVFSSKATALTYLKRLWDSFSTFSESHVILLEDDVRVLRHHTLPFGHSINGCNHNVHLPVAMVEKLRQRGYGGPLFYGACGGCVLDKEFFASIPFAEVERLLDETPLQEFYSDQLTSFIALYFGGTIGDYNEFYETFYADAIARLVADEVAFLHQYKYDYNVEPTAGQRTLLGPYAPDVGATGSRFF